MALHLTARHRARLAALRRLKEIRAEQAQLLAWYPDLRPDATPRAVSVQRSMPAATSQTQEMRLPGAAIKKYPVF